MKGAVIWITGLPSSGKSLLAERAWRRLLHEKRPCVLLDGDMVRDALRPAPGYDEAGRQSFYETLAHLSTSLARQGHVVLVPATAHLRSFRAMARKLAPHFIEVYVHATPDLCAQRDPKGLYARARAGEIAGLPGVDVVYEPPESPDVVALGGYDEEAVGKIVRAVADLVPHAAHHHG
jgi:adenylylsulfate kinase